MGEAPKALAVQQSDTFPSVWNFTASYKRKVNQNELYSSMPKTHA
jgi:hypothetical protein